MTMTDTYTWQAMRDRKLPTYRQIDYWCRTGAITPTRAASGSGSRREWTEHELDKLEALAHLTDAFRALDIGSGLSFELVSDVWQGLDESPTYTLLSGDWGAPGRPRASVHFEISI